MGNARERQKSIFSSKNEGAPEFVENVHDIFGKNVLLLIM